MPLSEWLADELMQQIACENNLPITVFFVSSDHGFHIRWFTPSSESNLCGHGTLAAAFVIKMLLRYDQDKIYFESKTGKLTVVISGEWITLNFPADECKVAVPPPALPESFGSTIVDGFTKAGRIIWSYSVRSRNLLIWMLI